MGGSAGSFESEAKCRAGKMYARRVTGAVKRRAWRMTPAAISS